MRQESGFFPAKLPQHKNIVAGTPPRPRFTSDNLYHIIGTKSGQQNMILVVAFHAPRVMRGAFSFFWPLLVERRCRAVR